MARSVVLMLVGLVVALPAPVHVAARQADGVSRLVRRLEQAVLSGRPESYLQLLSSDADREDASGFAHSVIRPEISRVVVRELERTPLRGAVPGDVFEITAEAFIETGRSAQLSTWAFQVKHQARASGSAEEGNWAISGQRVLGTLPAIYRLQLDERRQLTGRQLVIANEDLRITIPEATVFVADADGTPTAVVVLGKGRMRFAPPQPAERGQLKLFSGRDTFDATVDGLFLRIPPVELERYVSGVLDPVPVDARQFAKASEIFDEELPLSYGLDLGDLSHDTWSMLPSAGDFLAEIRAHRFGGLTYARNSDDPEDVSLFQRERGLNVCVYASAERLASRGRFYSDDAGVDYKATSYDVDASFEPDRGWLEGRTRMRLEVLARSLGTLTLRLADSLAVRSVTSAEHGRLLAVRVRGQNRVVVRLPAPAVQGSVVTLDVAYAGPVAAQAAGAEEQPGQVTIARQPTTEVRLEKSFLYSDDTFWYARAPGNGYSTATLRLEVPERYSCVASGELVESSPVGGAKPDDQRRRYTFVASRPVRYYACLITPLVEGASRVLEVRKAASRDGDADSTTSLKLDVTANPRLRRLAPDAGRHGCRHPLVLRVDRGRFAVSPTRRSPLVEWNLPGGHSPAYLAVLNQPLPGTTTTLVPQRPGVLRRVPRVLHRARTRSPVVGAGSRLEELPRAVAERGARAVFRRALRRDSSRGADTFDVDHAAVPAVVDGHDRPGPDLPGLPRRPHQERQPGLPGRRLQQERSRAAHAPAHDRRRRVLPRAAAVLHDVAVPEGGVGRSPAGDAGGVGPGARPVLRPLGLRRRRCLPCRSPRRSRRRAAGARGPWFGSTSAARCSTSR